jgi:hypothetical protein
MANPVPIKFTTSLQTRDGTSIAKDARVTNLIVEPHGEDEIHALKRPGYSIYDGTGWASNSALGSTTLPDGQIITFVGNPYGGTNNATMYISPQYSPYTSLDSTRTTHIVLSNSNLTATGDNSSNNDFPIQASVFKSSGKWYFEMKVVSAPGYDWSMGVSKTGMQTTSGLVGNPAGNGIGYYSDGRKFIEGTGSAYGAAYTVGDFIGCMFDAGAGTVEFTKNGTSQGVATTGLSGSYAPAVSVFKDGVVTVNFGNAAWNRSPSAGFVGWLK